ncbi:MAG: DUF3231 family protein [Chitinophagales bacterium]
METNYETHNQGLSEEDLTTLREFPRLTSAEVAVLWGSYQQYTLLVCIFKYFSQTEDEGTRSVINKALELSEKRIERCRAILNMGEVKIPLGFSSEDLNESAPELFSNSFILYYLKRMITFSLKMNTMSLMLVTAPAVQKFYNEMITSTLELHEMATDVLLDKGLMLMPPIITLDNDIDFTKSSNILRGYLGRRRPLLAIEIANLSYNLQMNFLGQVMLSGFAQVAQSELVKEYFLKGARIAHDYVEQIASKLRESNVPTVFPYDATVSTSTTSPWSDKLMLFHVGILNAGGMGQYGESTATSLRRDITAMYTKMLVKTGRYAEEGAKLMISKGWMEEPPKIADHSRIAYQH